MSKAMANPVSQSAQNPFSRQPPPLQFAAPQQPETNEDRIQNVKVQIDKILSKLSALEKPSEYPKVPTVDKKRFDDQKKKIKRMIAEQKYKTQQESVDRLHRTIPKYIEQQFEDMKLQTGPPDAPKPQKKRVKKKSAPKKDPASELLY